MGAAVVLVGLVLMIVIHEGAHFVAAKAFGMKATEAFFGFGPRLWSMRRGETEYGIKAIPLGGYVRIIGMNPLEEVEPGDEARTYRTAPYGRKAIVVLAGVGSHLVVAFLIFLVVALAFGVVRTDEHGAPLATTVVARVAPTMPDGSPTPASGSGIEAGDEIVAFDGVPVESWERFVELTRAHPGETVTLTVRRDGAERTVTARLARVERPVVVDGAVVTDDAGEPLTETVGFLGVTPEAAKERPGVPAAVAFAARDVGTAIVQSAVGLWQLVTNFGSLLSATFGGNDQILGQVRPVSPIGLVRIAGPLESGLVLLAIVNVFVGVLNVVPLYPLDGGHFAVATWERITGRAPDVRRLIPVAAVVLVFLVTLGLLGVYLDIFRPLRP